MTTLQPLFERNQEATVYVGNLDQKLNEELLWELFVQCGPVVTIHMPRDKITNEHQGYGFVEFRSEEDADYAIKIMHMIKLYGKPIKVNKASQDKRTQEVGANLFIGNLDPEVDEKMLYDTFSSFGMILSTKIMRDPESGTSKGYGFVSYDNFDSSDTAMNSMNGQYFCNRIIHVSYAYKRDTKGERHGSAAERLLAANRPINSRVVAPPMFTPQMNPEFNNNYQQQPTLHMPPALFQPTQMNGMGMMPPKNMGMPPMMNPMGAGQFGMKPPPFPGNIPMNMPPLPNLPGNL